MGTPRSDTDPRPATDPTPRPTYNALMQAEDATPEAASLIQIQSLTKRFGPVVAIDDVSFDIHRGTVHGLIGENGAGKSTLMKILAGIHPPTSGGVLIDAEPIRLKSPADAISRGIAMIHQELNLVDDLSVRDNLLLGREPSWGGPWGFIQRGASRRAAREAVDRLGRGVGLDPSARVGSLSIARQQMVEIAKALSQNARLLIMDEPTAVLGGHDTRTLFRLIAEIRGEGVTVIYTSHHLREVLELCDRCTVLRDGRHVQTLEHQELKATHEHRLATLMVGRPIADHFPPRQPLPGGRGGGGGGGGTGVPPVVRVPPRLRVQNLSLPGLVHDVSLSVQPGELLGIAGLIGAGRTELAEAIVGLRKPSAGTVEIDGQTAPIRNVRDAASHGLAYLCEDRKAAGLTLLMSIAHNITLASLQKHGRWFPSPRTERAAVRDQRDRLHIKLGRPSDPITTLSGGNQQKVALAKWLETGPRVLLLDEPTRGVDIGAKEEIYRQIQALTQRGLACIVISSEINELLGLCHRIAVMRKGRLVGQLDANHATEENIMSLAIGLAQETPTQQTATEQSTL